MEQTEIHVIMRSKQKGYLAFGIFDGKGLTVLKGSIVSSSVTGSEGGSVLSLRNQYVDKTGTTIEDIYFRTPSAASNFICGRSSNGWFEWVTEEGIRLSAYHDVERQPQGTSSRNLPHKEHVESMLHDLVSQDREFSIESKTIHTAVCFKGKLFASIYYRYDAIRIEMRDDPLTHALYNKLERESIAYQRQSADPYGTHGKYAFFVDDKNEEDALLALVIAAQEEKPALVRVNWDEYESALIIDTALSIEQGSITRKKAVSDLSSMLRQRAVNKGLVVDDVFRNENGINMQLSFVQQLLSGKRTGADLHCTKVFTEMISLYRADKAKFNQILKEAKLQCRQPSEDCSGEDDKPKADRKTEETNPSVQYSRTTDTIIQFLSRKKISFIDLRDNKGCLWIPGDRELGLILEPLRRAGVTLHFSSSGGSATEHRSAWWTKDRYYDDVENEEDAKKPSDMREAELPEKKSSQASPTDEPNKPALVDIDHDTPSITEPSINDDAARIINESIDAFIGWLRGNGYQPYAAKKMADLIKSIDRFALKNNFTSQSLYAYDDYVLLSRLWEAIKTHERFPAYNRIEYDRLPNAMAHYILFRKDTTVSKEKAKKKGDEHKSKAKEKKKEERIIFQGIVGEFHKWLVSSQIIDEDTADNFCRALVIVDWYTVKYKVGPSVLQSDSTTVEKTKSALMDIPSFWKSDRRAENRYNDAMTLFIRFLSGKEEPNQNREGSFAAPPKEASQPTQKTTIVPQKPVSEVNKETSVKSKSTSSTIQTKPTAPEKPTEPESKTVPTQNGWVPSASHYSEPTPQKPDKPAKPQVKSVVAEPRSTDAFQESLDKAMIKRAEEAVLKADLEGMTFDALSLVLRTSVVNTKRYVADSKQIIPLDGMLYHVDAFVDLDEAADTIEQILDKLMERNNGYVTAAQLYEFVRSDLSMFLNLNDIDDQRKVFDLAQFLFEKIHHHGKQYVFQYKTHISRASSSVSTNLDVMLKFARDHGGVFAEDDLISYLQHVGMKTGNLHMQMQLYVRPIFFHYAPYTFITAESMGINKDWLEQIRKALERLFADVGDHIVLRRVQPGWFALLPPLPYGKQWTHLLLQSVVRMYTKELGAHTIIAMYNQSFDTTHAMIVRNDSPIKTFPDVVAAVLIEDQIMQRRFEAEELRQLLVKLQVIAGNELIWNMPKALAKDERFVWSMDGATVNCVL